jgi:hypothetical protein
MSLANHKFAHVRVNNSDAVTKHPAVDLNFSAEAGSNETQVSRGVRLSDVKALARQ